MFSKTHYLFEKQETVCGIDVSNKPEVLRVNINDVTCANCVRIVTVFKSDHSNRPKKTFVKDDQLSLNMTDGNTTIK